MNVTIRPATRADLPGILAIYNDAVLTTTASFDNEPRTPDAHAAWFDAHAQSDMPMFVAVDWAGAVAGWSSLSAFRPRWGYRFTVENSVYVAAAQRGQGIGRMLLPPLLDAAQARGMHAVIAVIDASNAASIRLHTAFGFQQAAYFTQVGHKFGHWLDLIFMELLLDAPH